MANPFETNTPNPEKEGKNRRVEMVLTPEERGQFSTEELAILELLLEKKPESEVAIRKAKDIPTGLEMLKIELLKLQQKILAVKMAQKSNDLN